MNYLIIDTSAKPVLCIASREGQRALFDEIPPVNTSSSVIPAVDAVLRQAGLSVADLQLVACVAGPGSFTGIRIGVSVANAFGLTGCPRLGVNALDVVAFGDEDRLPAIPSRAGYCYTAQGELRCEQVGALASVGLQGSGAQRVLSRTQYIDKLVGYVEAHCQDASSEVIRPIYLKKSQAERMREGE